MNKSSVGFFLLILASFACSPYWRDAPLVPAPPASIAASATVYPAPTPPIRLAVVIANNLRLGDYPDGRGRTEILLMPKGSKFTVSRCELVNGQLWAYGSFTDKQKIEWHGWAAARFLKGACND